MRDVEKTEAAKSVLVKVKGEGVGRKLRHSKTQGWEEEGTLYRRKRTAVCTGHELQLSGQEIPRQRR